MAIRFRILGPVEVEREDGPVVLRGTRRRSLLLRLLISANHPVSTDRLIEDVWEDGPPQGAASTLASHVSLLRRALGSDRITHRAGGYLLRVEPGELDADAFGSDLDEGHAALRRGDADTAAVCFERSLRRWRGPALADASGRAWSGPECARLHELRLAAEESLLEARLDAGRHREVVAEALAAVDAEPFREQRWSALMTALYRSGRQAEALRAFQRLHRVLTEELGLEPSSELVALEQAIIQHLPELDWTGVARPVVERTPVRPDATSGASPGAITVVAVALPEGAGHDDRSRVRDALVQHQGREIPGGTHEIVAVFDGPDAALAAAAAMQQTSGTVAANGVGGLRIGVAAGELSLAGGSRRGAEPAEARTLSAAAGPGEVLVTDAVRALVGRRSPLLFDRRSGNGDGDGEGGSDTGGSPPRWILGWEPPDGGSAGLPPPRGLLDAHRDYVGRVDERARLVEAFERVASGERRVMLVGGEPGIGKTALTAVTARAVVAAGGAVLYGRCPELNAPYQPFIDALSHYVRFAPRHELEAHVDEYGGELIRLVPALAQRVPSAPPPSTSDAETERHLAFAAVGGLLTGAARHRPLLLILDDLHWADGATLHLLRQMVTTTDGAALLVLGTFRSSEVTADHPLAAALASLWREQGVGRIELGGLSFDEVLHLCASAAGYAAEEIRSSEFVAELQRDTGGNPFFVWELLRHLVESGRLVRDDTERWSADPALLQTGLPASLREVITQRVRHLGADAFDLLSLAAVIGVEFELSTLTMASGIDHDRLLDLAELAEESLLVTEFGDGGTFAFAHALTRYTLYDGLRPSRRRQLHGQVASALEEGTAGRAASARLAFHFTEAGELRPALHYAELAGHDALEAMAPAEAAHWFGEALRLLEEVQPNEPLRRCDFTMQLGVAQLLAADPAHRDTLLRAVAMADAADDPRRMAAAALANTRGYYSAAGQIDAERTAALQAALDRLGRADGRLRARLLAHLCSETIFELPWEERRVRVAEAVEEARILQDPATTLSVLNLVFEARRHPTAMALRLEDTELALQLAEEMGDPKALFSAMGNRMQTLIEVGRIPEAAELQVRVEAVVEELGQPVMRWMIILWRAQWAFLHGETEVGDALALEALTVGEALGQPDALNYYATQLTLARWQQGRLGEMVDLIETGAADNPGIPGYEGALARALCQAGRYDEARALLAKGSAVGFTHLPEDLLWTYGLSTYSEAAIQVEDREAAGLLFDILQPFERLLTFVGTTCEGPIAHYLGGLAGVLGRLDEADRLLTVAEEFGAVARSPFFLVRTRLEQGRVAARRGETELARGLLKSARTEAEAGGFAGEAARAEQALTALE